jgi:hypothetical protein
VRSGHLKSGRLVRACALLVACAAAALVVGHVRPAHAALGSVGCDGPVSQPFLRWLDPAFYTPIGSFEVGEAPWRLAGAASLVPGNEPWHPGEHALELRPGGSALSPPFCVDPLTPTVRLFARSASLLPSVVAVSVELDAGGVTLTVPIGVVVALPAWEPSPPLPLLADVTSAAGGSFTSARLRVTGLSGETRIDDVYVDPFKTS